MEKILIDSFDSRPRNCNLSKKKYAVTWLFYPNENFPAFQLNDYLYGCIVNQNIINNWNHKNENVEMDFVIITPVWVEGFVDDIIEKYFTIHIKYKKNINFDFLSETVQLWSEDEKKRWGGVMNKLYLLHPDLFGCYEKVMYIDSDLIIRNPSKYIDLLKKMNCPAGVYENSNMCLYNKPKTQMLHKAFRDNQIIEPKFCLAGSVYYHCVNASLYLFRVNEREYERICSEMQSVETFYKNNPNLRTHKIYFPEQEYLTNFFAGKWHAIDARFLSTRSSEFQCAGKFWNFKFFDRRTGIPSEFWSYFLGDSRDLRAQ